LSNAIALKDVSFSYGARPALDGVTLFVERGSFVSLAGPNGSGKTTLLRLVSGYLKPRTGQIEVLGRDVRRMTRREAARAVAVVPQESSSIFPFTVEEIVLMGRFPHLGPYGFEGSRDIEAAREAMALTDTTDFASRYIEDLSGGERQRVIIARALAQGAEILLLDEPTAFLDIKHQIDIASLVKRLQREKGLTVVMASHDLNLAAAFSDSVLLLKHGKAFAQGTPREVLTERILSEAYGAGVIVGTLGGQPFVAPRFAGLEDSAGDAR